MITTNCELKLELEHVADELPSLRSDGFSCDVRAGSGIGRSLCCCSWWTVWTVQILSGQLTFITETFELLTKSYAKFDSLFVIIREYSMRNCMFTW